MIYPPEAAKKARVRTDPSATAAREAEHTTGVGGTDKAIELNQIAILTGGYRNPHMARVHPPPHQL